MTSVQKNKLIKVAKKLLWGLSEEIAAKVDAAMPTATEKERETADEFVWQELFRQAKLK